MLKIKRLNSLFTEEHRALHPEEGETLAPDPRLDAEGQAKAAADLEAARAAASAASAAGTDAAIAEVDRWFAEGLLGSRKRVKDSAAE
jgi:hypothetical protein